MIRYSPSKLLVEKCTNLKKTELLECPLCLGTLQEKILEDMPKELYSP
jgi:hypothetical protein